MSKDAATFYLFCSEGSLLKGISSTSLGNMLIHYQIGSQDMVRLAQHEDMALSKVKKKLKKKTRKRLLTPLKMTN